MALYLNTRPLKVNRVYFFLSLAVWMIWNLLNLIVSFLVPILNIMTFYPKSEGYIGIFVHTLENAYKKDISAEYG